MSRYHFRPVFLDLWLSLVPGSCQSPTALAAALSDRPQDNRHMSRRATYRRELAGLGIEEGAPVHEEAPRKRPRRGQQGQQQLTVQQAPPPQDLRVQPLAKVACRVPGKRPKGSGQEEEEEGGAEASPLAEPANGPCEPRIDQNKYQAVVSLPDGCSQ